MSYLRLFKLPHFKAILIWRHCPFKAIILFLGKYVKTFAKLADFTKSPGVVKLKSYRWKDLVSH
jgi:hypothetical protein